MGRSDSVQHSSKRPRRRLAVAVLAMIALTPLLASARSGAQPSDAPPPFLIGGGSADGLRIALDIPAFLVVETVEVSAPAAQTSLDSGGNVSSYAALPYPGEVAANVGSVVSVLLGISFPVTPPGYVFSDTATPNQHTKDPSGTYEISAVAEPNQAVGLARLDPGRGSISSGVHAESSVTRGEDGSMRVHSESVVSGIDLGGIVRIGSVRSESTTVYEPGDEVATSESDFVIEALSVAGVDVGIGPEGLRLAGLTIPLPIGDLEDTLNGLLSTAGVQMKLLEGESFEGGSRAKGLEVTVTEQLPVDGNPTATVTYRIGGASSFITVASPPDPVDPAAAPTPVATSPPPVSSAPVEPSAPPPAATPAPVVPAPTTTGVGPTELPEVEPVTMIMSARDLSGTLRIPYLALVFGAAVAALGSLAWGSKGVRATWLRR